MNTQALISLMVSQAGTLVFVRWGVLSTSDALAPAELWAGRVGLALMAIGSGCATWFVCNPVAP